MMARIVMALMAVAVLVTFTVPSFAAMDEKKKKEGKVVMLDEKKKKEGKLFSDEKKKKEGK